MDPIPSQYLKPLYFYLTVEPSGKTCVERMKTFLSVRGLGEAQARAWIGYTFSKRSLNLGSFSLEHIR